jgi:hypothetical protein
LFSVTFPADPAAPLAAAPAVVAVFAGAVSQTRTVGEETQLTASVQFSDGHFKTGATTQVAWSSSDAGVLTVSASGVMRIVSAGEADVTATFQGIAGRSHVIAWPADPTEVRGTVRSTTGAPIEGARVHVGRFETISDSAGRFTVRTKQPRVLTGTFATAIHDEYEVAPVDLRPEHVRTPIDLALNPLPGRVYLRARGHNVCTELPAEAIDARRIATFAVQSGGIVKLVWTGPEPALAPFVGSGNALVSIEPHQGAPLRYYLSAADVTVEGGHTYKWVEDYDYEVCPQDYDVTIAHPR